MNNKITVIGAGSFGTALAVTLTDKGYDTCLLYTSPSPRD